MIINEKDGGIMSASVAQLRATRSGKLPPRRVRNSAVRSREYLTPDEVEKLMTAAKNVGRHGHRDATLILLGYRHGLRVGELVALRWDQVDLKQGLLHGMGRQITKV
jgi:integrase